jgi:hypothetical protein
LFTRKNPLKRLNGTWINDGITLVLNLYLTSLVNLVVRGYFPPQKGGTIISGNTRKIIYRKTGKGTAHDKETMAMGGLQSKRGLMGGSPSVWST